MQSLRVLGHRGAPWVAAENTLASFRAAQAQGADGVELDVRLCGTGELVVCHDVTLARFTTRNVRIAATSAWALRRYDLGGETSVPLLGEVLSMPHLATVNVEIKTDDGDPERLARAVANELRNAVRCPAIIVSSFDPLALIALRAFAPEVPRGLLISDDPAEASRTLASAAEVLPHAMHPHHSLCTPERVARWHALGLRVNTWTVDAPDDVRQVARAGVDAIITNVPSEVLAILRAEGYRT